MDDNKDAIRLSSVKRIDPFVVSILDSALRTALYNYDNASSLWTKTDVEGTAMVYSRRCPPQSMITIINRLSKENFREPITATCDLQVKPPFLLFKSSSGAIYGIWFPEEGDVHRVSQSIQDRIREEQNTQNMPPDTIMIDPAIKAAGTTGGDIMSMLSKAHGEFSNKQNVPSSIRNSIVNNNNDVVRPSPMRVQAQDNDSSNIADFFKKVGMNSNANASQTQNVAPSSKSTTNPVLQQLFQGAAAIGGQASVGKSAGTPHSTAPIAIPGSSGQKLQNSSLTNVGPLMSLQELEGRLKENLHVNAQQKEDINDLFMPQIPLNTNFTSSYKSSDHSLLSPQVFTTPQNLDKTPITTESPSSSRNFPGLFTPNSAYNLDMRPLNGSSESLNGNLINPTPSTSNITPLTPDQLVQSFVILLKQDDFVQKLHEAYIQALNQSIKGCL